MPSKWAQGTKAPSIREEYIFKHMNSKIQKLAVMVALLATLFVSGCASSSGGSSSPGSSGSGGRTFKQVDMDVSEPMTRFRNAVSSGNITQGEQQQVNSTYSQYRAAYDQALQAAGNNRDAPAPANVKALATQVIGAVQSIP
jgi:hypothetical protein